MMGSGPIDDEANSWPLTPGASVGYANLDVRLCARLASFNHATFFAGAHSAKGAGRGIPRPHSALLGQEAVCGQEARSIKQLFGLYWALNYSALVQASLCCGQVL